MLANQDTELTQDHSGRKAASRNSRGRCGGPPCPERHGCQSGVSRPSLISPRRLPVVAVEPKRRRWRGRAGDRGKHDSHRPFTNRKAAPGEGTVIRARVGRPVPSGARSAQGPVHFPPTWRVIMGRCHPGQPGQGRGRGRRAGWAPSGRERTEWNAQMGDGEGGGAGSGEDGGRVEVGMGGRWVVRCCALLHLYIAFVNH